MTPLLLLLSAFLAVSSGAAPAAPEPAVLARLRGSQLQVRVFERALSHEEQDARHAACAARKPGDKDICYWTGVGDGDAKEWLLSGPTDTSFSIDLKTRRVDYWQWPGPAATSARQARFTLDPVDLEGLSLPAESRHYARLDGTSARILRAVAREGDRRAVSN